MRLNRLAAMGSPVTCSCIDLVRPCRAAGRRWKARPIMSSASPCVADWIAGRLESRASASSLTDRQCIVLSSGRLACFAGPWVCLKEPPQPALTLPPSCYPPALHLHQLHCSPTASSQTLSLYHDTSPTAPLYKTPLQPPSSQHIHLSTRHRYQLQPALSPLSRPQPPHPRHHCVAPHRTATHQHCNHDAPLRLHLQHQLHGL